MNRRIGPMTLLGMANDRGCENFTNHANGRSYESAAAGYCLDQGRDVNARDGADQPCWPCIITLLLAART